jgi:predicted permease
VVLQVGLSTMLLTAAGLLVHSVRNLERVDPGFDPQNTLVFTVDPQLNGYEREQTRNFHSRALDRLAGLPGVRSASLSSHALIANSSSIGVSRPAGTPAPPPGSADARAFERKNLVWRQTVDGRFFETLGIPLLQGRTFARSDTSTAQPVAIVNRSLARQLFGTTDAIGRRFVFGLGDKNPEIEVIGIVADAKYTSMRREAPPTAYLHYLQQPIGRATYEIRTATNPAWHAPAVREAMRELDATLPLTNLRTLDDQIGQSLRREHLFARLATLLGGVTLVLSAIGLYGLLAYSVTRRTPEIGIRMALGAARGAVRWMVVRRSLVLVTMGLALGIAGAIAGTRVIESLLFGLTPTDPAAIAAAVAIMLGVSLAAAYVPARRASRVDPIVALRTE